MTDRSPEPPDPPDPRSQAARAILRRYVEGWRTGRRASIESLIANVSRDELAVVLRELLDAELGYLIACGEAPTIEYYTSRFPEHDDLVTRVFEENGLETRSSEAVDPDASTKSRPGVPGTESTTPPGLEDDGAAGPRPTPPGEWPERIGRYRVVGILGSGSYGRVYQAIDDELNRHVAIKVPHRRRISVPADVEAYLAEARNLARLDHPGVVPVYDFGRTPDGSCYLVSKLIRGSDLAECLRRRRPPQEESASMVAAIAEALHSAHGHGLVHRDIKPRNILIDGEGRPYIVDFGLALREEDYGKGPTFAGTPIYMSPEQARGEGHLVDGRSDIFSLGMIFYEILTGERPFHAGHWRDALELIKGSEPRPPRALAPEVDGEIERICLKALSKRLADRYDSALEMARDLRHFLTRAEHPGIHVDATNGDGRSPGTESKVSLHEVEVIPKGLRCFEAEDAGFFPGLLPGPRDREGLPERLRFWKTRVEEVAANRTFRVGVVYGPSGSGKSSMIRAGLLPRLDRRVATVLVEATPRETERRLLAGLRERIPGLSRGTTLAGALAAYRRGWDRGSGGKLLIVIDQFEQWLHANPASDDLELIRALRQCDGRCVQCLLIVRDDFWMSLTRFLQELEVSLVEGTNCAAVDLFDLRHASKVLTAFGRAFEAVAPYPAEPTKEQAAFIELAVGGLSREGRVVPIHLSLFAETVKARSWTPVTLRSVGGPRGVGVAFLDEAFHSPAAPPERRKHRHAAQEVLKLLLPDHGGDIRGHQRTRDELLRTSGYSEGSGEFAGLLRILDAELRLITPVDSPGDSSSSAELPPHEPRYQLTHDYLVSSIREWVTRQQVGSRKGRAEILLAERTALWMARPEPRHLPSTLEWFSVRLFTRPRTWSPEERKLLAAASRRIGRYWSVVAAGLLALVTAGLHARGVLLEEFRNRQSESVLGRLLVAEPRDLPAMLREIGPHRERLGPRLVRLARESPSDSKARLVAALALLDGDPAQVLFLRDRLLIAAPDEVEVIVDALRPSGERLAPELWSVAEGPDRGRPDAIRAACALASFTPRDPRWASVARSVATMLVSEDTARLPSWIALLQPVGPALTPALSALLLDPRRPEAQRSRAARALARYLDGDVPRLADLLLEIDPDLFRILAPGLRADPARALGLFEAELARQPAIDWGDAPRVGRPAPPLDLVAQVEGARGLFAADFALCHALAIEDFERIARGLEPSGYRPITFRPYRSGGRTLVATAWSRDGRPWRIAWGKSPVEIVEADRANRLDGLLPVDLACVLAPEDDGPDPPPPTTYAALWSGRGGAFSPWGEEPTDAALYVGVPEARHESSWSPLNQASFVPKSNFLTRSNEGARLYNSVRWKFHVSPRYHDIWDARDWAAILLKVSPRTDLALFPAELRLVQPRGRDKGHLASVWWGGSERLGVATSGLPTGAHLDRCRELAAGGYRPASLSVIASAPEALAASIWLLPVVTESRKDAMARRKTNAAAACFLLGQPGRLWEALRWEDDPRLKSFLVASLSALEVPPQSLIERLSREQDRKARRALIEAIAGYEADRFPREVRDLAAARLRDLWCGDADPGVHSAAELALRRWGHNPPIDSGPFPLAARGGRAWYVDGEGQTMSVLRGPLAFPMGSPGSEDQREHHSEHLHFVSLDRDIAVATTEVTDEQYSKFDPHHATARRYAPEPSCPVNMVSWFDAARYCNWRSERERIPRDQWCYPEAIGPGAPANIGATGKSGYRLPTEAEWEYLCRAGSTTSRPYGRSEVLLSSYAWTVANSSYRTWPVGRLLPNDFGLFDVLGNVLEWCHDTSGLPPDRIEESGRSSRLDPEEARAIRGGSFVYMPSSARSAQRDGARIRSIDPYLGFRVVRTLPRDEVPAPAGRDLTVGGKGPGR